MYIDPETDRIDFEIKLNPRETVPPSDRKTIEADLLIHRRIYQDNQWKDSLEIGVDFKHVRDGGVSHQKLEAEIEGIKTVIKTGQIHEFHFVTNGKFSKAQINAIHEANEVLQQDGFEYGAIAYHEQVKFGNL